MRNSIGFVQTDLVLFFKMYVYIVNELSQMHDEDIYVER